jgi:hypothetical protein
MRVHDPIDTSDLTARQRQVGERDSDFDVASDNRDSRDMLMNQIILDGMNEDDMEIYQDQFRGLTLRDLVENSDDLAYMNVFEFLAECLEPLQGAVNSNSSHTSNAISTTVAVNSGINTGSNDNSTIGRTSVPSLSVDSPTVCPPCPPVPEESPTAEVPAPAVDRQFVEWMLLSMGRPIHRRGCNCPPGGPHTCMTPATTAPHSIVHSLMHSVAASQLATVVHTEAHTRRGSAEGNSSKTRTLGDVMVRDLRHSDVTATTGRSSSGSDIFADKAPDATRGSDPVHSVRQRHGKRPRSPRNAVGNAVRDGIWDDQSPPPDIQPTFNLNGLDHPSLSGFGSATSSAVLEQHRAGDELSISLQTITRQRSPTVATRRMKRQSASGDVLPNEPLFGVDAIKEEDEYDLY